MHLFTKCTIIIVLLQVALKESTRNKEHNGAKMGIDQFKPSLNNNM